MIGWEDVYKVVAAMVPLYVALMLGYGSVRWWRIFKEDQCDAIGSFLCFFVLPLFTFEFTSHVNPLSMNFSFIAADVISKAVITLGLALWAKCNPKGSFSWAITSFSMCTMSNALVVGVPLMRAMYGDIGVDLVVQSSVIQAIAWLSILLLLLEFQLARTDTGAPNSRDTGAPNSRVRTGALSAEEQAEKGLEGNGRDINLRNTSRPGFWSLMKVVWLKLAMNPNSYACVLGIVWAFIANRWRIKMPIIVEGSILILSKAGAGTAMFNMGLFMGLQKKLVSCGPRLMLLGMVLRFLAGPAAMVAGSIAMRLHGDVLRVAIIQAALPQSITSFIFAKEYGLHADVLSTSVIFGTLVSLPVLIAYYAVLELLN